MAPPYLQKPDPIFPWNSHELGSPRYREEISQKSYGADWIRDSPVVVGGGGEKRVPSTPLNRTPGGSCGAAVVIGGVVEKTGDSSGPRAHAGISDGERGNCN
jgi:hypothetical protein